MEMEKNESEQIKKMSICFCLVSVNSFYGHTVSRENENKEVCNVENEKLKLKE